MVGVAIALMAQRVGAEVIIVGLNDDARLGAARQAGIPHTIDLKVTPLRDGESRIFPEGPDVVFEASGAAQSITDGLDVLRAGGILVAAGIHSHNIEIDFTQLVRRKLQVRGSHAWLDADWHTVMSFLSESPHIAEALISDRFALEEAHAAFDAAKGRSGLKVMLLPSDTID
jgi:L-iditol 2-dehydrogenase